MKRREKTLGRDVKVYGNTEIKHAIGIYSASIILMLDKYKRMLKINIVSIKIMLYG